MKTRFDLALVTVMIFAALSASAQTNEGRILGTVTDPQAKVIVKAKVTITNVDTRALRELETNEAGDYVAPNLPPGHYSVTAEASGFKKVERTGIQVEVAKDVRIDLVLSPGAVTEVVEVTGETPLIETTNDAIGGAFANKAINDLPLNGRDYQNLIVLRPGVVRFPGGGFESIAANGMRPEDNNFMIDGVDDNDPYYSGNVINAEGVQGTPGSILPIDAIQEFNTEENPSADYSYKPGVTINIGLKSGTNDLHGTGYYFGRNNWLDARNVFNTNDNPQTSLRQHQFGGSIGGPIIHNKTFIFGAYEGVRGFVSNSNNVFTPATISVAPANNPTTNCSFITAGDCAGSLVDALADLQKGGVSVNPESANLIGLGSFTGNGAFPGLFLNNPGNNPNGATTIASGFPNVNRSDTFLIKLDEHISEKHVISGRYLFGDSTQIEQNFIVLQPQWRSTSQLRAQVFGVNWTWTPSNRWVNQARFGYNRFSQAILNFDGNRNPLTAYGFNAGITNPLNFGLPEIDISGFTQLGNPSGWPLLTTPNQTVQFEDTVSYIRGKHSLRFGGEVRRGSTHNLRNRQGKGRVAFSGGATPGFPPSLSGCGTASTALEDFLAGFPSSGKIFVGDSTRDVSFKSVAGFVQDDWRATQRLTINAGLRYDYNTPIKEAHNLLGNFDPNVGFEQVGINISSPYQTDRFNFAPRVGIAWDPWGRGKTVLRAGFAVIYEIPHISLFIGQNGVDNGTTTGLNTIPTGALGSNINGNIAAAGLSLSPCSGTLTTNCLNYSNANSSTPVFPPSALNCDPNNGGSPCDILGVTRHLRTPLIQEWNFNIQQALTNSTSLQIAYVGNHGTRLYSVRDINQSNPAVNALNGCAPFDTVCEQMSRPFNTRFPFLQFINFLENQYSSDYHSLQVTGTQRVWHGLNFLAGYTWAHSIDFATNNRAVQPQNSFDLHRERASSDFDIRHRFTLALTYEPPSKKGWGQLLEGWQMNSIVTVQGGTPWTMLDGVLSGNDISLTSEFTDRWNIFGSPANIQATPTGIPFFPTGNADCALHASAAQLGKYGCFEQGGTVLVPPDRGTFGNLTRNTFRGPRLDNWDFSIVKKFRLNERVNMQLRGEFFNVLNHPHFANPESSGLLNLDPSLGASFGAESASPDVAAANPVIGTGGPRNIQLGIKFIF